MFGQAFALKAIPVTYLIDEVEIIRLSGNGPSAKLLEHVERILAEPRVKIPSHPPSLPSTQTIDQLAGALRTDPDNTGLLLALGQAYAAAGRFPEALLQLQRAAELDPGSSSVRMSWGMTLLQQGEREAALAKLKEARDLDPDNWRIRKQIWALENPDKFYTETSPDYGWQREQLQRERSAQ